MNTSTSDEDNEAADNLIESAFRETITKSHECAEKDDVARALLCFLVRAANSWRSIRTLRKHTADPDGFMIDAGTILRAMYDAYFQVEYIVQNDADMASRASDYFEFAHVERFKESTQLLSHNNWIAAMLKQSPYREAGQRENRRQFDRVKARFKKNSNPSSDATWSHFYPKTLAQLADDLNKKDEHDTFLSLFNGCVHTSAKAMSSGPPTSANHVLTMASTIVAQIARTGVVHNSLKLAPGHQQVLDVLTSPPGDRQ